MKTKIVLIILLMIFNGYAAFKAAPIIESKNDISYTIDNVKISKSDAFSKIDKWIGESFDNQTTIVLQNDEGLGIIKINAFESGKINKTNRHYLYNLCIYVNDNKIEITFNDFKKYDSDNLKGLNPNNKIHFNAIKENTIKILNKLYDSLK